MLECFFKCFSCLCFSGKHILFVLVDVWMFFRRLCFYLCFKRSLNVFPEGLLFCMYVLKEV
uniref:Candidate secreted effector n=1 Tax=Meloidogyne incognita TaxID=6306 RepID=A0A914LEC5_MELIC